MEKGQFFIFKMGLKFGPNMITLQINALLFNRRNRYMNIHKKNHSFNITTNQSSVPVMIIKS